MNLNGKFTVFKENLPGFLKGLVYSSSLDFEILFRNC